MTNKEQLRNQFEKDKGVRCITPKGDGDIRYVEFLESEIDKRDKTLSEEDGHYPKQFVRWYSGMAHKQIERQYEKWLENQRG